MALEVLFIDEVSMIDVDCWSTVSTLFAALAHAARPGVPATDDFGAVNVILFGDQYCLRLAKTCFVCICIMFFVNLQYNGMCTRGIRSPRACEPDKHVVRSYLRHVVLEFA